MVVLYFHLGGICCGASIVSMAVKYLNWNFDKVSQTVIAVHLVNLVHRKDIDDQNKMANLLVDTIMLAIISCPFQKTKDVAVPPITVNRP